ncbi:MAG: D-alanine--poly(phosphoribitol) ligase [Planctomycetota bacterium]|nr:MAG: D-alanine--poly(phosphoribitol) ligase [Planctomycetota bacterium]
MARLIHHYLRRQAQRRPEAPAIAWNEERWTFGRLDDVTDRIARLLCDSGLQCGDRVAIAAAKGPWAIAAMIGTLKAGGVYVPIDIASPAARVERVLRSCEPTWIVADAAAVPMLESLQDSLADMAVTPRVLTLSDAPLTWSAGSADAALDAVFAGERLTQDRLTDDTAPAHILFTSGSTGVPKGVVITHRNVMAFVDWAVEYFAVRPGDRVSGHAPLHFDLSTFDIYGALAAGAELYPVPPQLNLAPQALAAFIRRNELNQWFSVPSVLNLMAKYDVVQFGDFPALKRLMWCGEVLPTPTLRYLMERLPLVEFTNLYGPTEATIASSYYTVAEMPQSDTQEIPIGTACAGERLLVLDERLQPVPPETIGDLYIGGVGLSPGYWRDPEKTAAVFLDAPDGLGRIYKTGDLARVGCDGLIYFIGRADTQIKSRGYRIELGEIEAALSTVPQLKEAAVVAIDSDDFDGKAICCAFAPVGGEAVDANHVRSALRKLLPTYMLPVRWARFETLPKNANGKIDRRALREYFAAGCERAAQRTV